MSSELYSKIYAVVRRIPRGRVASYGQIAALAGFPGRARQVGYALHALTAGSGVPWQRVLNSRGEVSLPPSEGAGGLQRALLEKEGVAFDAWGRVSLEEFGWKPRAAAPPKPSKKGAPRRPAKKVVRTATKKATPRPRSR